MEVHSMKNGIVGFLIGLISGSILVQWTISNMSDKTRKGYFKDLLGKD